MSGVRNQAVPVLAQVRAHTRRLNIEERGESKRFTSLTVTLLVGDNISGSESLGDRFDS